jgi:hypothetical protein
MTHMTAETAEQITAKDKAREASGESAGNIALDRRYRQIGISAVAAAARYQGVAKNPAYAPAPTNWRKLTTEATA